MALTFRDATDADVVPLAALVNSAYRGDSSRAGWTTEASLLDGQRTDPDSLQGELADPRRVVILAEEGGDLIGCVKLIWPEGDDESGPEMGMLSVRPTLQASGLGKQLIAEVERRVRASGFNRLHLEVLRQRPELIAFYERRGFVDTGRRLTIPVWDERFGIPRTDDLTFQVHLKVLDG